MTITNFRESAEFNEIVDYSLGLFHCSNVNCTPRFFNLRWEYSMISSILTYGKIQGKGQIRKTLNLFLYNANIRKDK